jgi:hypothetical protein
MLSSASPAGVTDRYRYELILAWAVVFQAATGYIFIQHLIYRDQL